GILVSKTGKILSNETTIDMKMSPDMMNESWYIDVMEKGSMPVLTSIRRQAFTMDKSQWVISIGQEIVDEEGAHVGLFILDFSYEVIERFLLNLSLGSEGFAFILSDLDELVYHKDVSFFESRENLTELTAIQKMVSGYDKTMGKLTHQVDIEGTDWCLVGVSSLDHLSAARRQLFEVITLVALLLTAIAIGSGVLIASRISKPIRSLEEAMNHLSSELVDAVEVPNSCYEVDNLRLRFNEMRIQIEALLAGIKEKEYYLRESEIRALYSQINPHFLYNTLDTIIWMAEFKDTEKVVAITKALAQFFRISLSHGDALIPLSDEIEHIQQYLFIQEQRYGDQLFYEIEVSPELSDIRVPKIILQPIVENAIYHGIKPLGRPGHLRIKAHINKNADSDQPDELIISVSDDGVGFEQSQPKPKASETMTKLGGVGLDNVNRRIALIYGPAYGLSVESKLGVGTEVNIRIPLTFTNALRKG
ncbi:MAG TPA: sensor histidine kinase, partial [Clostridiales bacterium UBA8960]|nr:sensor histidine kinase [Clostridiales bacterium UBA8960]